MVHSQPIFDTTLEFWPETRRVTALCVPSSPLPLPLPPFHVPFLCTRTTLTRARVCVPARVPRGQRPLARLLHPSPSDETGLYNRAGPSIELNEIA